MRVSANISSGSSNVSRVLMVVGVVQSQEGIGKEGGIFPHSFQFLILSIARLTLKLRADDLFPNCAPLGPIGHLAASQLAWLRRFTITAPDLRTKFRKMGVFPGFCACLARTMRQGRNSKPWPGAQP